MNRVDDLIASATYRLRPDAELQADVERELRAHLEDSIRAARADGLDAVEAEAAAIAAFGNAEEVGENLWQANRRRMRFRAVAKWAARVALLPAGVLLAVWLCGGTLDLLAVGALWNGLSREGAYQPITNFFRSCSARRFEMILPPRDDLDEEQRLLLDAGTSLERWRRLVECCPDDPVYRTQQYIMFLTVELARNEPLLPRSPHILEEAKALIDAGGKTDPDNAFWNYMKADLLMLLGVVGKPG